MFYKINRFALNLPFSFRPVVFETFSIRDNLRRNFKQSKVYSKTFSSILIAQDAKFALMSRKSLRAYLNRNTLFVVGVILHLVLLFFIYRTQGLLEGKEATKYWGCAQDLIQGNFSDFFGTYKLYSGYVLYLLPFALLKFKIGALIGQVLLGVWAARKIQTTLIELTSSNLTANVSMILYFLAFPIHQWAFSYYSEGLFIPLSTVFMCSMLTHSQMKPQTIITALWVLISRPIGALFVFPLFFYKRSIKFSKLALLVLFPLLFLFLPILPKHQLEGIAENHVILGQPENLDIDFDSDFVSLYDVHKFTIHNMGMKYWLGLSARRAFSVLNPTRPWFSKTHNLLVSYYFLLYFPIVFSFFVPNKLKNERYTLYLILFLNILLVALTYDEWDARFYAPLLPTLIILSAVSYENISNWWKLRNSE